MPSIGVLIAVGLIAFAMFRFVGDPVNQMVGHRDLGARSASSCASQLGLDQPVDGPGRAVSRPMPRASISASPTSSSSRSRPDRRAHARDARTRVRRLAAVAAVRHADGRLHRAAARQRCSRKLFQAVSLIGISLPTFLIGMLLIYLFAVVLRWLPSFGRGDVVRIGSWWTTGLLTSRAEIADHAGDHARRCSR